MFEAGLTTSSSDISAEFEYSILTLSPPRSEDQGMSSVDDRRRSSSSSSGHKDVHHEDEDLTYFPILSLGGGEHQIEILSKVKRALESVVEGRWDCFHSSRYSRERRAMWRSGSKSKGDHDGKEEDGCNLQRDGTVGRDLRAEVGEVEAKQHEEDEDGESDTGAGEDFYLWIRDICVDRTDNTDRRQQGELLGKICGGAKEFMVAHVPDDVGGSIEIEKIGDLGRATTLDTV